MASSPELRLFPLRREGISCGHPGQACPPHASEEGVPNSGASPRRPGAPRTPHFTQPPPSPPTPGASGRTRPLRSGASVAPAGLPPPQPAAALHQDVPGEPRPAPGRGSVSLVRNAARFLLGGRLGAGGLPGHVQGTRSFSSALDPPPRPRAPLARIHPSPRPGRSFAPVQIGPGTGLVLRCVALLPPPSDGRL